MTTAPIDDSGKHYNFVSDAWRYVFGDNFHFGYFKDACNSIPDATVALIEELARLGNINSGSKVLDVGCGIGGPALYLHEKYGCSILGITTSEKGIKLAVEKSAAKGCADNVRFQQADALDNRLPDNSFDVVWQMESSHLMREKEKLFEENYRVLKSNASMLLCDMILKREFNELDIVRYHREIATMEKVFGKAKTETLEYYQKGLKAAGFDEVETIDISQYVYPTFDKLKENVLNNRDAILQFFSEDNIDEFLSACDIIKNFYSNNILGYGFVRAVKAIG